MQHVQCGAFLPPFGVVAHLDVPFLSFLFRKSASGTWLLAGLVDQRCNAWPIGSIPETSCYLDGGCSGLLLDLNIPEHHFPISFSLWKRLRSAK